MAEETDQNSKANKNFVQIVLEATVLFVISLFLISTTDISRIRHHGRRSSYQKQCFSNQRVLMGAIEMYNMDHNNMMTNYDNSFFELLVRDKYLTPSFMNNIECEFLSEGDLTGSGYIYCVNHGDTEKKKEGKDELASLTPKSDSIREREMDLVLLGFLFGPTLLYFILRLL